MLRKPAGKYNVSIRKMDTGFFGAHTRRLSLMIYYPSSGGSTAHPYMDAEYQKQASCGQTADNGVNTFCFADGQPVACRGRFPVVIYSHGLTGYQMDSTVLCADIASNRFIVVSVGHPDGCGAITYCDGEIICNTPERQYDERRLNELGQLWIEDIIHAIDCVYAIADGEIESILAGRLDIKAGVHLLGISFGGCCSAAAALQDERVIDAVNLDGGIFVELNPKYPDKPLLVLRSAMNYKSSRRLIEAGCTNVTVQKFRGISHWEFSDGVYLGKKGKANRDWADRVSMARSGLCLDFFSANAADGRSPQTNQ